MSSELLHVGAQAMCPHGGQVSVVSTNVRVKVSGQAVALASDTFLIAGCAFTLPGGKPSPCLEIEWLVPALRVKVNGQAAVLKTSTGICQSPEQAPQGPPNVTLTQIRVKGT